MREEPPAEAREPAPEEGLRPTWAESDRPFPRRLLRPLQAFLDTEEAGGILLLVAAVVAMVWANSPWSGAYERLWLTPVDFGVGSWAIDLNLREIVNEGLMTLFFFVVGLEIKRELATGELSRPRAAALPVLAAAGGMVVPALLYAAFNAGSAGSRGWGIPMATDIAFSLGVLALVGRRLAPSLKTFLLALAIVDDIGAIVVIALFYPGRISGPALGVALLLLGVMGALHRLNVRWMVVYVVLGTGVWMATFQAGIHATIAGAVLGILAPAVPFQRPGAVSEEAHRVAEQTVDDPVPPDADAQQWLRLAALSREAVSPLARVEALLHPWTSYVVIPVFALANAGVRLSGASLSEGAAVRVVLGIMVGLVVGKPLGIAAFAWLGTRMGWVELPAGARWNQLIGVAAVAGIGFTVSLFISELALGSEAVGQAAKVGVVSASCLAAVTGALLIRLSGRGEHLDPRREAGI